jgi:hypothetical protein
MNLPNAPPVDLRARNLLYFTSPLLWTLWPALPLTRRTPGKEEELGVLIDVVSALDLPGYSATVFLTNIFQLPDDLTDVISYPKEVFDTPEEIFAAGWRLD